MEGCHVGSESRVRSPLCFQVTDNTRRHNWAGGKPDTVLLTSPFESPPHPFFEPISGPGPLGPAVAIMASTEYVRLGLLSLLRGQAELG